MINIHQAYTEVVLPSFIADRCFTLTLSLRQTKTKLRLCNRFVGPACFISKKINLVLPSFEIELLGCQIILVIYSSSLFRTFDNVILACQMPRRQKSPDLDSKNLTTNMFSSISLLKEGVHDSFMLKSSHSYNEREGNSYVMGPCKKEIYILCSNRRR